MATHESIWTDPVWSRAVTKWCDARRNDLGRMTGVDPADIDTDELAVIWDQVDRLTSELAVWVRDLAVEFGDRINALPDRQYEHAVIGPVTVRVNRTEKWDGRGVLAALTHDVIDLGTGEHIDAVRVDTLAQVLPAVTEGQTSSRWKVSGLRAVLGDHAPDRYRTVKHSRPIAVRGTAC